MTPSASRFILQAGLLAVCISALAFWLLPYAYPTGNAWVLHLSNLFQLVMAIAVHMALMKASTGRVQRFVPNFMLATTLKLLINLGVIVVYAFTHRSQAAFFIASYFVLYVLYTTLEITALLKHLKGGGTQGHGQ